MRKCNDAMVEIEIEKRIKVIIIPRGIWIPIPANAKCKVEFNV